MKKKKEPIFIIIALAVALIGVFMSSKMGGLLALLPTLLLLAIVSKILKNYRKQ